MAKDEKSGTVGVAGTVVMLVNSRLWTGSGPAAGEWDIRRRQQILSAARVAAQACQTTRTVAVFFPDRVARRSHDATSWPAIRRPGPALRSGRATGERPRPWPRPAGSTDDCETGIRP